MQKKASRVSGSRFFTWKNVSSGRDGPAAALWGSKVSAEAAVEAWSHGPVSIMHGQSPRRHYA